MQRVIEPSLRLNRHLLLLLHALISSNDRVSQLLEAVLFSSRARQSRHYINLLPAITAQLAQVLLIDQIDSIDTRLGHLAETKLLRIICQLLRYRVQLPVDLGQNRTDVRSLHALRGEVCTGLWRGMPLGTTSLNTSQLVLGPALIATCHRW